MTGATRQMRHGGGQARAGADGAERLGWGGRRGEWLPDLDLNQDKQIQSLLCYRYTIGQTVRSKTTPFAGGVKRPSAVAFLRRASEPSTC